jgi:DNA processing protein
MSNISFLYIHCRIKEMKEHSKILLPREFPALLKEINDPPTKLFYKGTLPPKGCKLLAIVGSRKNSDYGEEVCKKLIKGLAGYNISIVSGLALGIDSIAHREALRNNIHTLSIPGSSIEESEIYPRTNFPLSQKILESGGCLLSEFPQGHKIFPSNFPKRNRIIAGISHATLIIEASPRSGTLITARLAMEYNRDVGIVPGSILTAHSEGAHVFLRDGAIPITSAEDILEMLDIPYQQRVAELD